jgi:hypothetical protein
MNLIPKFLKAKHWLLFLLTFGIPMIFQIVFMGLMISNLFTDKNFDSFESLGFVKFLPMIMVLFMAVLYGWFWSIAIGLQEKVPANVKMKVKKFKFFFFFPLIYLLVFMSSIFFSFHSFLNQNVESNLGMVGSLFAIIIPVHLFAMFCIFYIFYFVAKTIKTVELQREVTFGDFAGEFFLLLFYPIGIWIIQPKINGMAQ